MSNAENRQEKRFPIHWPVAIVFDDGANQDTYHGTTHDLSLIGCAVLTEHNVYSVKAVTILLSLPPEHRGQARRIIEIKARMAYTVLSAGHRKFRCGIQFLNFKDNGRTLLKREIEKRDVTVNE